MPVSLLALALSAFAIGTTEFVIMGLLPEVASDLQVSIPSAGWLRQDTIEANLFFTQSADQVLGFILKFVP